MERKYEVMFIVRPDMADEDLTKLVETLSTNATTAGVKILSTEVMGRRRLAYHVKGFADGNYVLLTVNADGAAIHELERRLRVNEPVIKFLTVRTDDSEKRAAKMAKHRASKVKRSNAAPVVDAAAAEPTAETVAVAHVDPAATTVMDAPEAPAGA
jgi:small subunit ribosomal protein S6